MSNLSGLSDDDFVQDFAKQQAFGADEKTLQLYKAEGKRRGLIFKQKEEEEAREAAAQKKRQINDARKSIAGSDAVIAGAKKIDGLIAQLGKAFAETRDAATAVHASAQSSLMHSTTTGQFSLNDPVQVNLVNHGLPLSRYGGDPSAPSVEAIASTFVESTRHEMIAQLVALGEKP